MKGWMALGVCALALAGCGEQEASDSSQSAQEEAPKDYGSVIWQGYTKEDFPSLLSVVGDEAFDRINDRVVQAAETVDAKEMCDEVVDASPSQNRSSNGSLVFFVDCADESRFYISEADIDAGFSAQSKLPGDGEGNATQAQIKSCRDQIRSEFGDVDMHEILGFASGVMDQGVIAVTQEFTVTNAYGAEEDKTATCRFQGQRTEGSLVIQ